MADVAELVVSGSMTSCHEREILSASELNPGDIVEFERLDGAYRHVGIAVGNGEIVHKTVTFGKAVKNIFLGNTMIAEVRKDDFKAVKGSGRVFIENPLDRRLRPEEGEKVAIKALKGIGPAKYSPNKNNCQHFAYKVRCGVPFSDQSLGTVLKNVVTGKTFKHKALPPKETRTEGVTETSDFVVSHIGLSKDIPAEENSQYLNMQRDYNLQAHSTSMGKVKGRRKKRKRKPKFDECPKGDFVSQELDVTEVKSSLHDPNTHRHRHEHEAKGADHGNTSTDGDETDSVESCTYDGDNEMECNNTNICCTWISDKGQYVSSSSAYRWKFVSPTTLTVNKNNNDAIETGYIIPGEKQKVRLSLKGIKNVTET